MLELTPGIRSLQIHYDSRAIKLDALLELLEKAESSLRNIDEPELPSRIVHLPLSWDDGACRLAVEKYTRSVRQDAPWCPGNIEFIRRINGLENSDQVKRIVFDAYYLVMGLGDVYLGAPVAIPIDPRHRLVTTKYNPARTWTAENSVGIGGSYLCVYGMEGPGGYQLIGRTLQMWNRYRKTREFTRPWLLRFFDQIRFYEVTPEELLRIRKGFPNGRYSIKIEATTFSLKGYRQLIADNRRDIDDFTRLRQRAYEKELRRWIESGQIDFEADRKPVVDLDGEEIIPENCVAIESPVTGNLWKLLVKEGDVVEKDQPLATLESMKMEIGISAPHRGCIHAIKRKEGNRINAGQTLILLVEDIPRT